MIGTIVREMRFQYLLRATGITGCTFVVFRQPLPVPIPKSKFVWMGKLINEATGFASFFERSAASFPPGCCVVLEGSWATAFSKKASGGNTLILDVSFCFCLSMSSWLMIFDGLSCGSDLLMVLSSTLAAGLACWERVGTASNSIALKHKRIAHASRNMKCLPRRL